MANIEPDQYGEVAKRLLESIRDDLKECNTAECRAARESAEKEYKKLVEDGDMKSLKKLDKLDEDIVKLLEAQEKMLNSEVEVPPCQHCGYNEDEKPKVIGRCKGEDHMVEYDEYDKRLGIKKCAICGDDIDWD